MRINLVVASNRENVIGIDDRIPWHNSEDLKNFKKITRGNVVVMGRKTYESIGEPLKDRLNIVVTNRPLPYKVNLVGLTMPQAQNVIQYYKSDELFIIGGRSIYEQFAPMVQRIYMTIIDDNTTSPSAIYFPWEAFENSEWEVTHQEKLDNAVYLIMDRK
jgi:dihydrofolate reductase